jgi:hypothetical protein
LKVANWLVHYPYHYPLGTEIGYYFYGTLVDTTAHFWATDGLAALGLPGILLVSALCAFLFWIVDSATARHDPRLAGLVTFYAIYSLANLSLFTTFLSGGLGLLVLLLHLLPPVAERHAVPERGVQCAVEPPLRGSAGSPYPGIA